jgi:tetratricopeptide (TPR) repeat protein
LSAVTPFIVLLLLSKLELGAANDWDIFASVFFLVNLLAAFLFFHAEPPAATRTWLVVTGMTVLNTIVWLTLNASTDPAIGRSLSLWDKRNLSHMGHYASALQLSRYYAAEGDSARIPWLWASYAVNFPGDPRGYANAIDAMGRGDSTEGDLKLQLYSLWMRTDPSNADLRSRAMTAYIAAANASFSLGDLEKAHAEYLDASRIEPQSPDAYNGLGSVEAEKGNKESAIALFQKAIQLDSNFVYPYENLSTLYDELGDKKQSARYRALAADLKARRRTE